MIIKLSSHDIEIAVWNYLRKTYDINLRLDDIEKITLHRLRKSNNTDKKTGTITVHIKNPMIPTSITYHIY